LLPSIFLYGMVNDAHLNSAATPGIKYPLHGWTADRSVPGRRARIRCLPPPAGYSTIRPSQHRQGPDQFSWRAWTGSLRQFRGSAGRHCYSDGLDPSNQRPVQQCPGGNLIGPGHCLHLDGGEHCIWVALNPAWDLGSRLCAVFASFKDTGFRNLAWLLGVLGPFAGALIGARL